ncbi:hypothetical protein [Variovorax sp. OAS795]|uniref:hypothetical protein n=1 Tax=Variovorax sp. OAS795 TaxID=3034231 RepID=UPI00339A1B64
MSLKVTLALLHRRQRGKLPVAVVNDTYRLAPWAEMLYGADADWWRNNRDARQLAGIKVCSDDSLLWPEVMTLRHTGKVGFDPDPHCIRSGGNSGYQAVHVAAQAGAARILLCGFDMGGAHWHDAPAPAAHLFATWIERFQTLADALRGQVEILNCTPGSAMKCFPIVELESVK